MKSKRLIISGAVGGFLVGKIMAGGYFGNVFATPFVFTGTTAQYITVILASMAVGAFIGHILRH